MIDQNSYNYARSMDWINFRNYQMSQEHMDNYMQNIQFKSTMPNPYHNMRSHSFMQMPSNASGFMEQSNQDLYNDAYNGSSTGSSAGHGSAAEMDGNDDRGKKGDKDGAENCRVTRSSQRKEPKQKKRKRSCSGKK